MSLIFSRGRIVGMGLIAFLIGVAVATLGMIPLSLIFGVKFLFVCSILLLCWRRSSSVIVIGAILLGGSVGILRAGSDHVPFLDLTRPFQANRVASVQRKLTQGALVPDELIVSRGRLTAQIQKNLPPEEAGLLAGILYGDQVFSKETKTTFRRAGIMHIVAVSGSNISILILVLTRLILRCGCSRRQAWFVLTMGITLFVLFVTPSASVVRAAVMGSLLELAPLFGRLVRPLRLLLVAGAAFVFWQPSALLLDPSFILSFLAMIGLICLGPWLERLIPERVPKILRETVVTTFAATFLTAPYSAWSFGSWSVLGCVTNLFIVPLVPWTMFFGAMALFFSHPLAFLPVRGCLSLILWIAHLTDGISFGVWDHLKFPWMWMISIYIVLFYLWRLGEQRKRLMHKRQ
jgi:ComEC/Rec2-related protein